MKLEQIKEEIIKTIEEHKEQIIAIGQKVQEHPEPGYCEQVTSALVRKELDALGIGYEYPLAVTGVKGRLYGKEHVSNVCVIGEMDCIKCAANPMADESGNAHACGHHAQIAALIGAAIGLEKSGVMEQLDGDVTLMAVPAEEFIELDARKKMKDAGKITYFGGKQQLIAEGAFDDVDMAMMLHAQPNEPEAKLYVQGHNLGFLSKKLTFHGKAVHGSTPFDGVNALNAAALAILGVHANRETFREEDRIRIHPIITKGGDVVNAVPDEVVIETYVRGATHQAIAKGDAAVERAAYGAASMVGARVSVENLPGYLPLKESSRLSEVMEENAAYLLGEEALVYGKEITGSTDMGDLSSILPVIQPSVGGFQGVLHSQEFCVAQEETAYVTAAKLLALTAAELLYDHAAKAVQVSKEFEAPMTKEAYLNYLAGEK